MSDVQKQVQPGTVAAVSGRVQRRQAEKYADRDANIYAQREAAYQEQTHQEQPSASPEPAGDDLITQLKELAELKNQGILTEEEFAAQKAKILDT